MYRVFGRRWEVKSSRMIAIQEVALLPPNSNHTFHRPDSHLAQANHSFLPQVSLSYPGESGRPGPSEHDASWERRGLSGEYGREWERERRPRQGGEYSAGFRPRSSV